jgi:hypothetical protein
MSPVFFILYFGIKEKSMQELKEKLESDQYDKEFNNRAWLFVYLFLSFAALMMLAVIRKHS